MLVDSKFNAKVADFGLTQKRQLGAVGTPFWMAPELLVGGGSTPASDVYSFGILLSEVYTGRDPYDGQDAMEVLRLVVDPTVEKRPDVKPGSLPAPISLLMRECWQSLPELRPPFEEIDRRLNAMDTELTSVNRDRK